MMKLKITSELTDKIESLEAYLDAQEHGTDFVLEKLGDLDSSEVIRRRLAILLKANRASEASQILSNRTLDEIWMPLAIQAAVTTGDITKALYYVNWVISLSKKALNLQCAVAIADGIMAWLFTECGEPDHLLPGTLSGEQLNHLRRVIGIFQSIILPAEYSSPNMTEIEAQALIRLLNLFYLATDTEQASKIARILTMRRPLPLRVIDAVFQKLIPSCEDFPERLRTEHAGSFEAELAACHVEGRFLDRAAAAFDACLRLPLLLPDNPEINLERFSELLYELALQLDTKEAINSARRVIESVLPESSTIRQVISADITLRNGDIENALYILESVSDRDEPNWIRVMAVALQRSGREAEALIAFKNLALIEPDLAVFRKIFEIATNLSDREDQMDALERMLSISPDNVWALRSVAQLNVDLGNFDVASDNYARLAELAPGEVSHFLNFVTSLSFSGKIEKSLIAALAAFEKFPENVDVVILLSRILAASGDSKQAFLVLDGVGQLHAESPSYLLAHMNAGFASGDEYAANRSLARLQEMSSQGLVGPEVIRAVPFEELLEMVQKDKAKDDVIHDGERTGRMPWTMTADIANEVPYWAWMRRTQPMRWILEEPAFWVSNTIYSTNYLRVVEDENGVASLAEIVPPKRDSTVVMDISALITLHELGLLDVVSKFFEKIYIPAEYLKNLIRENTQLFPHQASQYTSAQAIKKYVDTGRIAISRSTVSSEDNLNVVEEYSSQEELGLPRHSIRDLVNTLHEMGILSDQQYKDAERVAHRPSTTGLLPDIHLRDNILVDFSTITTLVSANLIDAVVKYFTVMIDEDDFNAVISRLQNFASLDEAKSSHSAMWRQVMENSVFETVLPSKNKIGANKNFSNKPDIAMAAMTVARESNISLFADDRVCQAVLLNERRQDGFPAFGTDQILLALLAESILDIDQVANHFLRLMEWRYRFLVVSPQIMLVYAKRYILHPPGAELRVVSRYIQDSMRDPGLFAGLEQTDPPSIIALRLHQTWARVVVEFLIDAWMDLEFSVESLLTLTRWAIGECIPAPPFILPIQLQSNLGSLLGRTILSTAMLRSASARPEVVPRVNQGLTLMTSLLDLNKEYFQILSGVANVTDF